MENNKYKLVVSTEVLSFFNHTVEYVMKEGSLEDIDDITYTYRNEESFFNYFAKCQTRELRNEFEREHGFSPTEYLLGENGVYITKDDKKIHPLYKNIKIQDKEYSLEDIILSRLYNGNLLQLYLCDKYRASTSDYDSFFSWLDESYFERIELGTYDANDVRMVWGWIKDSKRRYQLMRFLMRDYRKYEGDISKLFMESIPAHENYRNQNRVVERNSQPLAYEYNYRPPYKDD